MDCPPLLPVACRGTGGDDHQQLIQSLCIRIILKILLFLELPRSHPGGNFNNLVMLSTLKRESKQAYMAKQEKKNQDEQTPQKSKTVILDQAANEALSQIERERKGLILSGLSAGLDIGFSVILMAMVITLFQGILGESYLHVATSLMYPFGFMLVVLGRSELFTEHTTLAVLPVLKGKASIMQLLQLWGIIYLSNIAGGALFAVIIAQLAGFAGFIDSSALVKIQQTMTDHSFGAILTGAILAGWLMGLLAWLVAAARETISQIIVIFVITFAIGFIGLHHCIVGNVEVLSGMFVSTFEPGTYLKFLGTATLGNAIGGVIFVAILKYSHIAYGGRKSRT